MRSARAIVAALGATAVAAAAPTATATPIAVTFEGTFTHSSGSPASIPFTGTLFYDSDTPNTSAGPPSVLFRFAPGTAGIRIDASGAIYASDPASPDVAANSTPVWLDANGNPTSPNDPDAMPGSLFAWTSFGSNVPSDVSEIRIEKAIFQVEPALPDPASALAGELVGASVGVQGDGGLELKGAIASAVPIPEPSSAALLQLGLALLALRATARGRSRRWAAACRRNRTTRASRSGRLRRRRGRGPTAPRSSNRCS